jgi:transposase
MIRMVQIEYIRKMYFKEGKSIRDIAKFLGHSRNTISKYLHGDFFTEPKYSVVEARTSPVLNSVKPIIDQWLAEDEQMPKKQRHSGVRIYQRLVDEHGFTGGSSTVRNYVYQKRAIPPKVFIPLEYELGSNAQCDWGQALAIIGGQKMTVHLFCMVLSASGAPFVHAFPNERQEAFMEGHRQAFEYFGGIPQAVTYDNLKSAVKKMLSGPYRVEQDSFVALRTHYLFDSIFCNPAKGNEKGLVEGFVGYARRNFFVPLPEFNSLAELNQYLREKCQQYIAQANKKNGKSVAGLFDLEKAHLRALPRNPFPCCRYLDTEVNSYSQVSFDNNRYSVPTQYAYQKVQVHAYVDYIEIFKDTRLIISYDRCYGQGQEISIPDHYLDDLLGKPRAVMNAKPLNTLPAPYQQLRQKISHSQTVGNQEFIKILKLHRSYPADLVDQAVELALAYEVYHFEGVRNLLLQLVTPEIKHPRLTLDKQPQLNNVVVLKPQLEKFNQLLQGGTTNV